MERRILREGGKTMRDNGYKELSCRSIGNDCDFMIRAGTEDEVLHLANIHLCEIHDVCALPPGFEDKIIDSIKGKSCDDRVCTFSP
jgi:predicted small metal-binding protein